MTITKVTPADPADIGLEYVVGSFLQGSQEVLATDTAGLVECRVFRGPASGTQQAVDAPQG